MKCLLFLVAIWACLAPQLRSQDTMHFEFNDGIDDSSLKRTMEQNNTRLLTAINIAETGKCDNNYSGIGIDNNTAQRISALWRFIHMHIIDDDIIERCICIKTKIGDIVSYEVQNIKVILSPLGEGYEGDLNQEVCVYFCKNETIVDFNITLGKDIFIDIFREGKRLDNFDWRMQILHIVEQFYNAYVQKDINFMNAVLSDDVLFITENILKRIKTEEKPPIARNLVPKEQYLSNLNGAFASNIYINVKFDSIKIVRHPTNPNFYGVTLIQQWRGEKYNGSVYADEGTLFLIWDFTDELKPQIPVCTWKPINDQNPIYKLSDFRI